MYQPENISAISVGYKTSRGLSSLKTASGSVVGQYTSSLVGLDCYIRDVQHVIACEPAWPSGKALGWKAEGSWFDPLPLSFLFSSKIVVYGHCLVTLPSQLMKH